MREMAWCAFVAMWGLGGWLAGAFFARVRHLQLTGAWRGKRSLHAVRTLTLFSFLGLLVLATYAHRYAGKGEYDEMIAMLALAVCGFLAYRRGLAQAGR